MSSIHFCNFGQGRIYLHSSLIIVIMRKIFSLAIALCVIQGSFAQDAGSKIDTLVDAYAKLYKFNGSA
ncbi:MAG: hypothetical protein ACRDE8_00245, partial [Ginsengibacter sp.]